MGADVAAIVPAAGAGRRLSAGPRHRRGRWIGGAVSKLFVRLDGRPLLAHTLKALQDSPAIRWIIPVVPAGAQRQVSALLARHHITKALPPCIGGASRAESVARGLAAVPPEAGWVLVHDGARPFVSRSLIRQAVAAAKRHGAVACGLPARLTIKAVDDRQAVRLTLDRDHLWLVQTPQVFRRDWFDEALKRADHFLAHYPDDAAVVEAAGFPVRMVPGDPLNIKITTREDFLFARAIVQANGQRRSLAPW